VLPDNPNKQEEYLMRVVFALIVLIALMAGPVMAQDVTTDKGKLSYAVGWDIGKDSRKRPAGPSRRNGCDADGITEESTAGTG
jgi:hypothetical protein